MESTLDAILCTPLLKRNKLRPETAAVPGPYDQLAQRKQSKDDVNSTTYGLEHTSGS